MSASANTTTPQDTGLYLLDYGAGNVRSLANSIEKLGYSFTWVKSPEDLSKAKRLIFPGVGAFATAMSNLRSRGLVEPLKEYIANGRPYFGICIGMQILFRESTEAQDIRASAVGTESDSTTQSGDGSETTLADENNSRGLGIIDWEISRFDNETTSSSPSVKSRSVPHMGWNAVHFVSPPPASSLTSASSTPSGLSESASYYFVHSYRAPYSSDPRISSWAHTTTQYGDEVFVSTVKKDNVLASQFHPEKSGKAGLEMLKAWLEGRDVHFTESTTTAPKEELNRPAPSLEGLRQPVDGFRKRIIACLDVRANDQGDLVVTKGDQYDVREKADDATASGGGVRAVRNLGKPVALARRYYDAGADEICLLNITSFRNSPLKDQPMLEVVREAATQTFVPLTIGGGIKDTVDPDGTKRSALEVAGEYFRAGADKVSIGSEAVVAVEKLLERGGEAGDGRSAIEQIARAYGRQAVVVSIDPKRVFIPINEVESYTGRYREEIILGSTARSSLSEEKGLAWWYQCTVSGGRTLSALSVVELAKGSEKLGAGEILVNSIDRDGGGRGFDLDLINLIKRSVKIPVVASSGAGNEGHFVEVFKDGSGVEAALAAGIFHRGEVAIKAVKERCEESGLKMRLD
ncbi:Histidine biosynthesis bifunctional protein hisB [Tulasnella sp. JGI-2019a]|nr:Histidine biosynthesis bifunctional protein hisB [Tulasnella sp. JGI-2019a]KAG9036287.1 Histidine biosynthesis bifunctional protein hisB [Tulasnella sp. JGI-2019a]